MTTKDSTRGEMSFHNIDSKDGFDFCYSRLNDLSTTSFVVDFGQAEARCALNLDASKFATLFEEPKSPHSGTRWINFWGGPGQRDAIKKVASRYGLSPRLVHLLCPNQTTRIPRKTASAEDSATNESFSPGKDIPAIAGVRDSENNKFQFPLVTRFSTATSVAEQEASFGNVIEDLWHFCTIDWGEGYVHLGLNLLFSVPDVEVDNGPNKPKGLRIWTSLILCKDGTVISVYQIPEGALHHHPIVLKVVRRNVLNVFKHLSTLHNGKEDSLMTVTVRSYTHSLPSDPKRSIEPASLLLYYLLDDWVTTFGLVTQRDHPYRTELEKIRARMFQTPDILVIERLHSIGRQLQVLKLMYQSYELIVNRILQRQRTMENEGRWQFQNHHSIRGEYQRDHGSEEDPNQELHETLAMTDSAPIGVRLSMSAIVRFERLLDRIRLLPLTEIEECLNEKESLVMMSFNLITLKESQAIEKLTRITILLAKATILFLPVSLMTGYFSVQIQDLQGVYSAKTYWLCFLVIAILSIGGLFVFGVASDQLEGRVVYKSLTRTMLDKVLRKKRKIR